MGAALAQVRSEPRQERVHDGLLQLNSELNGCGYVNEAKCLLLMNFLSVVSH